MRKILDRLLEHSYVIVISMAGLLALVFMVGPVAVALAMSFTDGQTLKFPPDTYSLRWYRSLLDPVQSAPIQQAAMNSLKIAALAVLGAVLFAVPAAFGMTRLGKRPVTLLEPLVLAPLVLPSLVYGLAALLAADSIGLRPSLWLVVAGHVVIFGPLMYRSTLAIAQRIDPHLEEASTMLGIARLSTFIRVTLPLLLPGVFAGAFLVFMQSLDNVSITLFLADARTTVLPLRMFQMVEESLDVRVAAVSGVLITLSMLVLLLIQRLAPLLRQGR
ncbi:putative spermidine/putrescine transport system permease protein [Rhodoferax sp. OV413]|uniref:ABC transporter permease n=1 Tax=Rhodoferax sp. OV413 TaxID=1855285 RepID=UPI000885DCB0|nr:ABC transporter permease [Rhodoferax sp. OV413]SDP85946.1 putative spermidine/putrescine transport system permease protein [Rhodoferax sp. OV413]